MEGEFVMFHRVRGLRTRTPTESILCPFQHSMRVVTLCNKLSRSRGSLGTPPPVRKEDVLSNMKAGEPASEVREGIDKYSTFAGARLLH